MTTTREKSSTRVKRTLGYGLTFLAGLTAGVLVVTAIQNLRPQNEQDSLRISQRDSQLVPNTNTTSSQTDRSGEIGSILEILNQSRIFDQQRALYASLSSATEQELKVLWIQSREIKRDSHRETAQDAILQKLASINPQHALVCIEDESEFRTEELLLTVFGEWSVLDLDSAIEFAISLSVPRRNVALQAILETRDDLSDGELRAIARQFNNEESFLKLVSDAKASERIEKPSESWDILLNDDVDDSLQTESLAIIAEAWREQIGFEVLSHIYHEIEDYSSQLQLVKVIAQVDPASALDHARGLPVEYDRLNLSRAIIREWAKTDAQTVLAKISTFEPSSFSSNLEDYTTTVWARTSPNEVIENVESISEKLRLPTLETAFANIARKNPTDALAKLSTVESLVGNTSSIVNKIVTEWSYQHPLDAAEWVVNNFGQEDSQRHRFLANVLPRLALRDPTRAFEIAQEQPTPTQGLGLEHMVIREIARAGKVEDAMNLLPQVKETSKAAAYQSVGELLVRESRADEALELGNDLGDTEQQRFNVIVMSFWASTDPKNLFKSLEDMPSRNLESLGALSLISVNRSRPSLTAAEIEHAKTLLSTTDQATLKRLERR